MIRVLIETKCLQKVEQVTEHKDRRFGLKVSMRCVWKEEKQIHRFIDTLKQLLSTE